MLITSSELAFLASHLIAKLQGFIEDITLERRQAGQKVPSPMFRKNC